MATPRWHGDEIGMGVGDAGELAPGIRRLLDEMVMPDWVTEDPRGHLLGGLTEALHAQGSRFRFVEDVVANAVYVVTLGWGGGKDDTLEGLRREVFALVGAIAQSSTHVHERIALDRIEYDVVTGTLDGDSRFRTHGFMLRLRIGGDAARRLAGDAERDRTA